MANLLHHVYFIQNIINKGVPSDDSRFSNRLISHALKQARSRLVKIKLDKQDYISEANYQKLCIPLELHTYHNCHCITDNQDCQILRSKNVIPKYMVAKWGPAIQPMSLAGVKLSQVSITSNNLDQYSLTAQNKSGYFIDENYLYILNNIKLRAVLIKGIWEDPEEVLGYNEQTCTELDNCEDILDQDFPIDAELVYPMYQLTMQLLGLSFNMPEDTRNDGRSVETLQYIDPNEAKKS